MDEDLSPPHADASESSDGIASEVEQQEKDLAAEKWRQRNEKLLAELVPCNTDSTDNISLTNDIPANVEESNRRPCSVPSMSQRGGGYLQELGIFSTLAVETILARVLQDVGEREDKGKRTVPQALPQELNVPLVLRCAFCQKFDSLCSRCHRKWKETLRKRRGDVARQVYCRLPEMQRRNLLFLTAVYGTGDFAAMQLDYDVDKCLQWQSPFYPLSREVNRELSATSTLPAAFKDAGEVTAMHVAFAYNRVDVVAALLSAPRCPFLKSSRSIDSIVFLQQPLSPDMEEVLGSSSVFTEHLLVEVAKQLRRKNDWERAKELYAELLELRPDSEYAYSGMAKMCYEQGLLYECIRRCDALMSSDTPVRWNEISPSSIQGLRDLAVKEHHEYSHSVVGGPALKECGCIILDRIQVPVRRLPLHILRDHIFTFCDGEMLWNTFQCSRIPLLRDVLEKIAVHLPMKLLQRVLELQPGFHAMLSRLTEGLPLDAAALVAAPVRPLGLCVVAMADFNMFLVKAYAAGAPPKKNKKNGSKGLSLFKFGRKASRETATGTAEVVISKQYRIDRNAVSDPWRVKDTGEWEAEQQSNDELEIQLLHGSTTNGENAPSCVVQSGLQ